MTFEELARRVFSAYEKGNHAEALAAAEEAAAQFAGTEQMAHVYFWEACLNALLGRPDQAVAHLAQCVEDGLWIAPFMLLRDPDLASLQGRPDFEAVVRACDARRAEAQAGAVPRRLTFRPGGTEATAAAGSPLLIALHGNNSSAEQSVQYWRPAVDAGGMTLAMLQSSQVLGPTAFAWNDFDWGTREVRQHLAELAAESPVDPARTVVGGFSRGAGLALWVALSGAVPLRGFIAVGPGSPDPAEIRRFLAEGKAPAGLRGYFVLGERDPRPLQVGQEVAAAMREYGLAAEVEVHPDLGHSFPATFDESLRKALRFILGG